MDKRKICQNLYNTLNMTSHDMKTIQNDMIQKKHKHKNEYTNSQVYRKVSSLTTCKDTEFYEFPGSHSEWSPEGLLNYFWKRRKIWKSKMLLIPHLWILKDAFVSVYLSIQHTSIHHNFKIFNLFWCHLQWRIDGFKKYKQKYFGVNANEPSLSMLISKETFLNLKTLDRTGQIQPNDVTKSI